MCVRLFISENINMSFKCQIFPTRLTFNNNVFVKNCDVSLIIILCCISAILPIIRCAKLENPQIRLLINDDDLLQEKTNIHEASSANDGEQPDNSGEHFNLYRSELKRLSYETIHRILRDENEPSYRREETELRYYQKRSPSYEENHQLMKRSAKEKPSELNLRRQNLTEFLITPELQKRLKAVSSLDLTHNQLNYINISLLHNISSLSSLNLQNNIFTFIPLKQNTTLRSLNLNNNLIRTCNLSSNIYLRNLHLSHNLIENLSALQLSLLKNLETLDVSNNLLQNSESSFFTERMHNLKHLNLAFNQLDSIYRETFYNLLSLNTLLLSHNHITDIDYETFLAVPNLQFLDLSFNNLRGKSIRALQGITGLVALNIAFNPDIGPYLPEFVASWSLKELDASGTGLCQIPAALAQSVRSLKLTHNWLKVINCGDLDSYPLLQYLDLSFSNVEHIEDDALGRLEILEILMLDHNLLRKVPVSLPVSLEHLFLQNNELMEITHQTFQGLVNLKTLDLSHNKLLYFPDINLPKLQRLNLQSAEIRGISQGIIHTLPKLNDLMLEDNPIKCTDLLGIAEWASTCRLRMERDLEADQVAAEEADDNAVTRTQDLKSKYEIMHNFYEHFDLSSPSANYTLLTFVTEPACTQNNPNALARVQTNPTQEEGLVERTIKASLPVDKTIEEEIKFNSNSKTYTSNNNSMERGANEEHLLRQDKQKKLLQLEDKNTPKAVLNGEYSKQSLVKTKQSSISNENQHSSSTKSKSFPTNSATTNGTATPNGTDFQTKVAPNANHIETDFVTQAKIAKIKLIQLTRKKTTANTTSHNAQQQIDDAEGRTKILKTAEIAKAIIERQWTTPAIQPSDLILSANNNGGSLKQSTTYSPTINSEQQTISTGTPPTNRFSSTDAAIATSTMASESLKHDNDGGESKQKFRDVVAFERTTSNLDINLEKNKKGQQQQEQQQHEIITAIAATDETKSVQTINPKSVRTNKFKTAAQNTLEYVKHAATTATTTKTNITMAKRTLKSPPKPTANKELNGFLPPTNGPTPINLTTDKMLTTNPFHIRTTTTTTTTTTPNHIPAIQQKPEQTATTASIAAAVWKTFKKTEQNATTTTTAGLVKDKDLASNYNDNENKRQITKTINKTSNISTNTTAPPTTTITTSSSDTSENNKRNPSAKTSDIATATTTTVTVTAAVENAVIQNIVDQQMPSNLLQDVMMSHYPQYLQKDVIVKCTQSNANECNSAATTTIATQRPDELGRTPTIEATMEQQTMANKTPTEILEAATTTTALIHKREPLQLLVKDRHLIGTPLLMHKGANLMVTADELILPTKNHNAEQDANNSNKDLNTVEANTKANDNKYTAHLESSQSTKPSAAAEAEAATNPNEKLKINKVSGKNMQQDIKAQDSVRNRKPNDETKPNPYLTLKKMTIITKQHEEIQPSENEAHVKHFDNSHYQELKPLAGNLEKPPFHQTHTVRHSTVNTPSNTQSANLLKEPETFQHEHELLIQQLLQNQQDETHAKLTKSEQWSDLRKADTKENHPGLILLVSSGLFLVLLVGLMHVYRCDMPWRRHAPSHHLRPHQRQNHSLEDDSHSFLSYSEGMQRWHHSTRLEAPYNSPLHNLHVRELQKTSATEKPATVQSTITTFTKPSALSRSIALDTCRSLSQSSTTTTSNASVSSSAILDDESFYIEMTPDSAQFAHPLQSELLPMELLNVAQMQTLDYQDIVGDLQTSMEDDCAVQYQQQQQQQHLPHLNASTATSYPSAVLPPSAPSTLSTTCPSLKPQFQKRKLGLW